MTDPCDAFISLVVRSADDTLPESQQRILAAHVATCAACREALAAQRRVHALLRSTPESVAPAGFDAAVLRAIRAQSPWTEQWNWRVWTWRLAPVAALLVLATVGVVRAASSAVVSSAPAPLASHTSSPDWSSLASESGETPVSSALWSQPLSDQSLLSLVLTARADDPLSSHLKDKQP